ncbi:MAG: hypothetical protein KAH01_04720 [Caldisericia bacterium]|nr:hypothetical protein [Caldisericia bacterium]
MRKKERNIICVRKQLNYITLRLEQEEDGSYTGFLKEIDLACNALTSDDVKTQIAKDLWEYANEYMEEFDLYYNSPNRRSHYPYVFSVLMQSNPVSVEKIIG